MTNEFVNAFINGAIDFTLSTVVLTLSIFALAATWKWLIGLAIRFIQWLCPGLTKKKDDNKYN